MNKNKGAIVKVKSKEMDEANNLIRLAIEKNVDVETMNKLMAMRKELKQEWAKERFFESLSQLQSELPVIKKNKTVKNSNGTFRYSYASLDSIVSQTKHLIKKHGFSYFIDTKIENGAVNVVCKVSHQAGHTEQSSFSVPIDHKAVMNEQQKVASALTYAKRYAFCNAFGILTGDEDDDAIAASEENEPQKPITRQPFKYPIQKEVVPEVKKEEKQEEKQTSELEVIEQETLNVEPATPQQKNAIRMLVAAGKIDFKGDIESLSSDQAKTLILNSYKSLNKKQHEGQK